jgi:hypothetical protein
MALLPVLFRLCLKRSRHSTVSAHCETKPYHSTTMKNVKTILGATLAAAILALASCKKDPVPDPQPQTGEVNIEFEHAWGPDFKPFRFDTALVHPTTKDTLTFQHLRYYITNIRLQRTDGSWWAQDESYYLVDASTATGSLLKLSGVPAGEYKALSYMLGVDSARNVSGAQSGFLSPTYGMYWPWTGYINIRAEGISTTSPTKAFTYHLGGYSGADNTVRTLSYNFPDQNLRCTPTGKPQIHMKVNVARFWHGGIKTADIHTIHAPGPNAVTLATNFAGAFVLDHVHN